MPGKVIRAIRVVRAFMSFVVKGLFTNDEINDRLFRLTELYEDLPKVAEETLRGLGKEQSAYFTELINDWGEITGRISDVYPKDECVNSLLYIYLQGLPKEIYWFQLLFLTGNYPLLQRSLRYVWEMIFRSYYVDTYMPSSPKDPEPPGSTLDEKVAWLEQYEKGMFKWEKFMRPRLRELLPEVEGGKIEQDYESLWYKFNESVHPSKALLERMLVDVTGSLMINVFDEKWALETLKSTEKVFDIIWLTAVSQFPQSAELIRQKGLVLEYPLFATMLRRYHPKGEGSA